MTKEYDDTDNHVLGRVTRIVCAFVSNPKHRVSVDELQALIRGAHSAVSDLTGRAASPPAGAETSQDVRKSKAEIRKSIGKDSLTSFEDGRSYKSLRRHLTRLGMTPQDYRSKYGLPSDYPMVHPDYSARRSELAKAIGLGSKGRGSATVSAGTPKKTRSAKR